MPRIIIEFRRAGVLGTVTRMGIDRAELAEAVTAAGFDVEIMREWPGWDHYVAVFVKSGGTRPPTG